MSTCSTVPVGLKNAAIIYRWVENYEKKELWYKICFKYTNRES